eukprot:9055461-Pyramimonas_sp.AAC.1
MRQFNTFAGDRGKFREMSEQLHCDLTQVRNTARLEAMGGALDADEDDVASILSGRLTAVECATASAIKQHAMMRT